MKRLLISAALAAISVPVATAAGAQVTGGIATANPVIAIASSKAFQTANQQIQTTYKSNFDQIEAKLQQRQTVLKTLDKNHDNNVDQAELNAAEKLKSPALKQVDTIEKEIQRLQQPAQIAQVFAIESIAKQYQAAMTKVVTDRRIGVILKPDSFVYAPDAADVTSSITAALDQTVPSVSITPPANYQPSQTGVELYREIQQLRQLAAAQQAQQPAAAAAAPTPRPAQPQPQQQQPQGR
jgi:Skp family chaperone for outer membrane proteins